MKKRILAGLAVGAAVTGLSLYASNTTEAATSDLTIDAVIVEAISLDCDDTALDFGQLDASAGASTVTVDTANVRASTQAGTLVGGTAAQSGVCALDGEDGLLVDVNIPDDSITDGSDTITINNFTMNGAGIDATAGPNDWVITLPAGAAANYTIGGDLVLLGTEGAGNYTGTVTVTVTYQ